tara:strand:+ start:136 stop:768 length:633 start_codon:yes stop_codon:yes gene_type:complete
MKKFNKIIIIFDLDGVLINTIKLMELAWSEVQKTQNIKQSFSNYKKYIGLPFNTILKKLKISKNHKKIYEIYNKTSIRNEKIIKLYPGVKKILLKLNLKGYKTAIVTSKEKSRAQRILKRFKIPINNINCPNKKYRGKPFPDQIFRAIKKSRIKTVKAIYIGDMHVDYETSKNSKIDFIFAKYGYESRLKTYKNTINTFYQIPKILERLN